MSSDCRSFVSNFSLPCLLQILPRSLTLISSDPLVVSLSIILTLSASFSSDPDAQSHSTLIHSLSHYRSFNSSLPRSRRYLAPLSTSLQMAALQSRSRISNRQRLQERLAADPVFRELYNEPLRDVVHYKALVPNTIQTHDRIKRYWREFLEDSDRPDFANVSKEIIIGTPIPSTGEFLNLGQLSLLTLSLADVFTEFARYLSSSLAGKIDTFASIHTVTSCVRIIFACFGRYALKHVHKDIRNQVYAYISSNKRMNHVNLTTKSRPKPVADRVDVDLIIRGIWETKTSFKTNRMRSQIAYTVLLSALSSERPGAVVESTCWRGSNEAIWWSDHQFVIIPRPDHPNHPIVTVIVTIRLLKGKRGDESLNKLFFLLMEPEGTRSACPIIPLLHLALEDDIFEDVHTIEEIFHPMHAPTRPHILSIKPSSQKQLVLRADELSDQKWSTSATKALNYAMYSPILKKISLAKGFAGDIQP